MIEVGVIVNEREKNPEVPGRVQSREKKQQIGHSQD